MAKKNLVLLTKQYPFYHKEQYITNELLALSKVYDKIYIYPAEHFDSSFPLVYSLPPNAQLIDLNLTSPLVRQSFRKEWLFKFFKTYLGELVFNKHKLHVLKKFKRYYSTYTINYSQAMALMDYLNKNNINIEETTFYSYWFSNLAFFLALLKEKGDIQHFYSKSHAIDLYHEEWSLVESNTLNVPLYKKFKSDLVDQIFPISAHGERYLKREFPNISTKIFYLGAEDYPMSESIESDELFTLVTCSHVDMRKRVYRLGEALSLINRPIKWVHFGGGTEEMEQMVRDAVTSPNVRFELKGKTPNAEIRKYYASNRIDLFVNLSKAEGVPVSIMEAIAHGIPILATDVFGTAEVAVKDVSGKLISADFTNEQLAEAIIWFMDHPEEVNALRVGARKLFEERFNAHKNHAEFANYLISLP
ncbi:MAG TPA: glycosyltransferase [Flavobacteriales bacterium]